ncbi:hypothetical protein [Candidatus Ichthyocystis hellenicum]|uniref:hypothetical protein n=1 Tax=Candidatus Ichthyocystis hellenicum TaxID=1561003 RepID=UPI000B89041F|nr:hypothetical protein [Candidatus Ichthyocystis hellenicum]
MVMKRFNVSFLNTVGDDSSNLSGEYSLIDSFLPVVIPYNAISRISKFSNRALGKAALCFSILANLVDCADAETISELRWELLKSRACALIFLQSRADESFRLFQNSSHAYYLSIDVIPALKSVLGDSAKFSRDSTDDHQAGLIIAQLKSSFYWLLTQFAVRISFAKRILQVNIDSDFSYGSALRRMNVYSADINYCPNLYDYFNDTVPTSISEAITSTVDPISRFGLDTSTTDPIMDLSVIFFATMLIFTFMFLLLRCKRSRLKIFGVANRAVRVLSRKIVTEAKIP